MSLSKTVWAVAIVVLVGSVLTVLVRGRTPDAAVEAETVEVVRRTFASTVAALGAVKPQIGAEVRVGSRISGRVQNLAANVGDRVKRGQVIAELETAEYDALVAERQADLRFAESALAAADAFDPGSVARAEAQLEQAEATALLAAEARQRYETLLRSGLAATADAEVVLERHQVAQAQLKAAQHALDLARSGGAEQRRQAAAAVDRARAALESAVVERSFTSIRAPISGVVASVATQEGETVAAGLNAPTFLTIVDLDRLHVEAYVDEVDIGKIVPGQKVNFTVDAFPALDFDGHVTAVYPSATIQDNVIRYVTAVEIESDYGVPANVLTFVSAMSFCLAGGTCVFLLMAAKKGLISTTPVTRTLMDVGVALAAEAVVRISVLIGTSKPSGSVLGWIGYVLWSVVMRRPLRPRRSKSATPLAPGVARHLVGDMMTRADASKYEKINVLPTEAPPDVAAMDAWMVREPFAALLPAATRPPVFRSASLLTT